MASSKRELILQNVKTTLEGITVANGYEVDIQKVVRTTKNQYDETFFPLIIIADNGEEKQEGTPATKTTSVLHLELFFWNNDYVEVSERSNQICAAIEKAISVDQTRGGHAYDTDVTGNQFFLSEENFPFGGGMVSVDILYRHLRGDPYTS